MIDPSGELFTMSEGEETNEVLNEEEDFEQTIGRFILASPPEEEDEVYHCLFFQK